MMKADQSGALTGDVFVFVNLPQGVTYTAKCQVHFNQYITWGPMPSTCRGRVSINEIFLAPSNSTQRRVFSSRPDPFDVRGTSRTSQGGVLLILVCPTSYDDNCKRVNSSRQFFVTFLGWLSDPFKGCW